MDRRYPSKVRRSVALSRYREILYEVLRRCPKTSGKNQKYVFAGWGDDIPEPLKAQTLVVDATDFPQEGPESLSRFVVRAVKEGWKDFILFNLRGHRFVACGLQKSHGISIHVYGSSGDYLASGLMGAEVYVHGNAQDQVAQIIKDGKLVVYGDVGQALLYGAKGGEVYIMGSTAGRPLINAVGCPRVVINGTCLDYLAESMMAGDPLKGGGFAILNGITFDERGRITELPEPYPGGNLFSLASGGAIYVRDPYFKVGEDQLNGGKITTLTEEDWNLIEPYLRENERLFGIPVERLLTVEGKIRKPWEVYRKVEVSPLRALQSLNALGES
jgi:glutamate synthase domain-containing protein 3